MSNKTEGNICLIVFGLHETKVLFFARTIFPRHDAVKCLSEYE
jgi:hypothetical protein